MRFGGDMGEICVSWHWPGRRCERLNRMDEFQDVCRKDETLSTRREKIANLLLSQMTTRLSLYAKNILRRQYPPSRPGQQHQSYPPNRTVFTELFGICRSSSSISSSSSSSPISSVSEGASRALASSSRFRRSSSSCSSLWSIHLS